jgi:hypothetical protein
VELAILSVISVQFGIQYGVQIYLRVVIVGIFIGGVAAVLQQRESLVPLGLFPLT